MHPKLRTKEVMDLEIRIEQEMIRDPPTSFEFGPLETIHWVATHLNHQDTSLLRDIEIECGWEISNSWWIELLKRADLLARPLFSQQVAKA